jgi:hemerythrin-like domain-containing protein
MADILEELENDHRNLEILLKVFEHEIDVHDKGQLPDFEILNCILEYCVDYPDHYHHPKEESVARQLIRRKPSYATILAKLPNEHLKIATLTQQFSDQISKLIAEPDNPNQSFVETGRHFVAFYRDHMQREESILFAPAREFLTPADWAPIISESEQRPDPLFDDHIQDSYHALHQRIVKRAKHAS